MEIMLLPICITPTWPANVNGFGSAAETVVVSPNGR